MTTPYKPETASPDRPCALFWDESLIWGIMARRALSAAWLPFDLLTAADIRQGMLTPYRMLFVPGGWASNKLDSLGKTGRENIRRFVESGGSYFGICGGAGMALEEGLGLLSIARRPSADRVPSFSGPIRLDCRSHPLWEGIHTPEFYSWWPSQFHVDGQDMQDLQILAVYEKPLAAAFSADINMADGEAVGWPSLEKQYGILLNPKRLQGEPAVLEGRCGHGKVILSLIHFDTPDDPNGSLVLQNIWQYLASCPPLRRRKQGKASKNACAPALSPEVLRLINDISGAVGGLFDAGARNFLWHRRTPLLLQWRRGVRGLEYSTLIAMTGEIASSIAMPCPGCVEAPAGPVNRLPGRLTEAEMERDLAGIRDLLIPFIEKAKTLLAKERLYMQSAVLSPLQSDDGEINSLRKELFGPAMRHGGEFKNLVDSIDRLLYKLIQERGNPVYD